MQRQNKILAVDDNELNLEIIKEALGDEYNLKTATTGEEALEIALDYQPDIVLLDVMMPDTDGYKICQQMRADPALQYLKIIMLSAKAMTSERLKGYDAGADDYIIKPFDSDELLAKVRAFSRISSLEEVECLNKKLISAISELRCTNKELEELTNIAANDFKIPPGGIGALADWISTNYADKFDEEGRKRIRMLAAKAEQITAIIDNILQYSRLGRENVEKEPVDLNTVLPEVIEVIEPPENIEIIVEDKLPVLTCERTHVIQAFLNLLNNAVKYIDKPRGQIKIGCLEQDDYWRFSVADNGPGIKKEHFVKIFRMFQTNVPKDEFDGIGIGLGLVERIVQIYGGTIWVESELGQGSTFFFTIPKHSIGIKDAKLQSSTVG